jgi:hypothetical protein
VSSFVWNQCPVWCGIRSFRLDDQYEDLYRLLTDQPATPPPLGKLRHLPPLPPLPQNITNPYPGLAAFKPEDCRFFFGREKETAQVVERLEQTRFLTVVGGSGTGKSSLVAAGVVPALRKRKGRLTYLRFKPQADPFRQLAETIDRALPEERLSLVKPRVERLSQELDGSPEKVFAKAIAELGKLQAPLLPVVPIMIFVDQFEELFTQTPPQTAQRFRALFEALRSHPSVFLVLTLRSEFMPRLMEWLGGELFASSLVPLNAIRDETRLREIIVHPARESGVAVQPELLSELLLAAHELAGALPLLALTLTQLFERRDLADGLTLAVYEQMGGLPKIVETAAAGIDQAIDDDPLLADACERLFAELATVIDDLPTRRTAEVEPLRADTLVSMLVDALRAHGLLADPDERHVELAHETLLKHWPRLREWCARYADKLALRRQAEQAAGDWQKARTREESSGQPETARHSDLLRWTWERQKPALQALLALSPHLAAQHDPDFADAAIDAWHTLQAVLSEPLQSFLAPEPLRLLDELSSDDTPHQRREEIGLRLNQMGDPRRGVGLNAAGLPDLVWINIPAGEVTLETKLPETFAVSAFQIARYPITWKQYRAFVDSADGYRNACWWDGLEHKDQPGADRWAFANYPAINVSWYDAIAFCRWLSHRLGLAEGRVVRLAAEWEWQWVAQAGAEACEYPWGGEWNVMRANNDESGIGRTTAVGMYPLGVPDCWPVLGLTGNILEWCLSTSEKLGSAGHQPDVYRVLRGGSWSYSPRSCRAAARIFFAPDARNDYIGFRVCRGDPLEPSPTRQASRLLQGANAIGYLQPGLGRTG